LTKNPSKVFGSIEVYRNGLSATDHLLNPCLKLPKMLENLKGKPCSDDYTEVPGFRDSPFYSWVDNSIATIWRK